MVFTSQSLDATQQQIALTEQGQLTERFGKAVEQLGSDKLDVRLGGIYAMERLARDSARDHPTIMAVLAAFVRSHAPLNTCLSRYGEPAGPGYVSLRPAADVQAALTVMGRDAKHSELGEGLDLSETCLDNAVLIGANFSHANLYRAFFMQADLSRVDLTGSFLVNAAFNDANLADARLDNADLSDAFLDGANLSGASLNSATLTSAKLANVNVTNTTFNGRKVTLTDLATVADAPTSPSVIPTSGPAR